MQTNKPTVERKAPELPATLRQATRAEALIVLRALQTELHHTDRNRDVRRPGDPPFNPTPANLQLLELYLKLDRELGEPLGDLFLPDWAVGQLTRAFLRAQETPKPGRAARRKRAKPTTATRDRQTVDAAAALQRSERARKGGLARQAKAREAATAFVTGLPPGPPAPPVPPVEQVG